VIVVTTHELAWGYRLAGVAAHGVDSPPAAAAVLDRLAGEADLGVVGVHEPYLDSLPPALRRRLEEAAPALVAIPAGRPGGAAEGRRARLADLLERAVGYHMSFPGQP
jgi:vacuolar-type H+-ATPase subunit F/Vma7